MDTKQVEVVIEIFEKKIKQALGEAIAEAVSMSVHRQTAPEKLSGLPVGVTIDKRTGRYGAKIRVGRKLVWLGTYESADDAGMAFRAAKARREAGLEVA